MPGSTLNSSIRYLKGIGPKRAEVFSASGINTVEDLLYYFPRRYEDRRNFVSVAALKENEPQVIKVKVLASGARASWRRRGFSILEIACGDDTGRLSCVWFNQPYLKNYFKAGVTLVLYGKPRAHGAIFQMVSPEFEIVSEEDNIGEAASSLTMGRITPVYSLLQGFGQRVFRRLIKESLDGYLPKINDFLPFDIRSRNNLLNLAKSLKEIHFPDDLELQKQAYERLSFDEFFLFQVLLALRKAKKRQLPGIAHKIDIGIIKNFIDKLPFKLTVGQAKVVNEIIMDMSKPSPMQRLLQGDVGSGKTVVAFIACLAAISGGYQAALMAPTEILARQHYEKIKLQAKQIRAVLLASSIDKKEKEKIYQQIKQGDVDLVIGTHALLQEEVKFKNLGFVVIDEQHKFGVGQRALLPAKSSLAPDVLIMTATPIPRTLAITLYGDLDISVIDELPPGRMAIKTFHFSLDNRQQAYEIACQQLRLGRQAYVVYPVIEESYALDIRGAKLMFEQLKNSEFKSFRVGLIHGKLAQDKQDKIMRQFKNKELDVLVATTVLEVGIDMPEAVCMIIEHSERFGLSQLHQLRGRVGRGIYESFCLLISDAQTEEAQKRLAAMIKYNDGFHIAEEDLKIRGPGEFFGNRQHGLNELKIANPLLQMQLLKKARDEAIKLVNNDQILVLHQNIALKEKIIERFPEYEKLMVAG